MTRVTRPLNEPRIEAPVDERAGRGAQSQSMLRESGRRSRRHRDPLQRMRQVARFHPAFVMALAGILVIALLVAVIGIYNNLTVDDAYRSVAGTAHTAQASQTPNGVPETTIGRENANIGTYNWLIAPEKTATTQIQAYAGATVVQPGQQLTFYVSAQVDRTHYTIEFYRLGWYGRTGGRLMLTTQQVGRAQGYYDQSKHVLENCSSCLLDPSVHLVDANWQPSYVLTVPTSWLTGVYEAKFTDSNGMQTYVTFDVGGDPESTYLVVTADTTEAAYNQWGGYSLYQGPDGSYQTRAYKVSLNRPIAGVGTAQGLNYEIDVIRWLERNGYDVSYTSLVDVHEHPEQLLHHRAILFLGHSEYWSEEMRNGAEAARDEGIGLAFLGADDAAWQIRMEPAHDATPDRTIVCYKSADLDPLNGRDNARVTVNWRSPPVSRPENALIGIMFSSLSKSPPGFPWQLSGPANSPLLAGTGLQPGQSYGCEVVGYEWDRVYDNGATPARLVVLGASPTRVTGSDNEPGGPTGGTGATDISNTTYYVAHSGALVFAAGSIFWGYALDSLHVVPHPLCAGETAPVPGLQKLMANVMAALIVKQG
jgi:hypothetical protein